MKGINIISIVLISNNAGLQLNNSPCSLYMKAAHRYHLWI